MQKSSLREDGKTVTVFIYSYINNREELSIIKSIKKYLVFQEFFSEIIGKEKFRTIYFLRLTLGELNRADATQI